MTAVNTLPDHGYAGGARETLRSPLGKPHEISPRGDLRGALHRDADAAGHLDPGIAEDHRGGGRLAADLLSAHPELRQLSAAVELPGRAAGLPVQQHRRGVADDRLLSRADHSRRLRAGALPHSGEGRVLCLPAAFADHPLSGVGQSHLLHVRQAASDQLAGRAGDPAHGDPDAVFDLCDAQQLRSRAARARRGSSHRRLQQLASAGARLLAGDRAGASSPSRCSPSSRRGTSCSARS